MTNIYCKKDGYLAFSISVVIYLVAQLVLGSLLPLTMAGSFWYCLLYALVSVAVFVCAFVYAKITRKNFWQSSTANVKPRLAHILWGCLATLGLIHLMLPLNELLLDFIQWCGLARPSVKMDLPPIALVVITVLLAPIAEELLFRGTIGNGFCNSQNQWKGILLSGALFALYHTNPAQTLHQFVLGSLLMLFACRSGSVWTSVIIHAFNNLCAVVLSYTVEPTGFYQNNGALVGVVGGVIFVGAIVGYLFTTKSVTKQLAEEQTMQPANWITFGSAVAVCLALWIANLLVV